MFTKIVLCFLGWGGGNNNPHVVGGWEPKEEQAAAVFPFTFFKGMRRTTATS